MQTSSVKAALQKLRSVNRRFSKIKAALPTDVAFQTSEPETETQAANCPAYETTNDYRAQLEAQAHIAALAPRHTRQRR